MSAKFRSFESLLKPDPKFKDKMMGKFINCLMEGGKKSTAQKIFYSALDEVHKKIADKDGQDIFTQAVNNVMPVIEVRSRRVGGATYQVPVEVVPRRARTLAVRWLVEFARQRREKTMAQRLANELMDATNQQGGAYKRKDDIYRMAQANKAFAHYRW